MGGDPPKRISQLSQDVVDKIAAGEVVVRPMNVVKELIENSLDAAATEITVSVGGGGMQMIRVQDNGHGIAREDLPIVCCRFTTSKINSYEDLRQIKSFGFRGEAMASISSVANLTVSTRTAGDVCAHKAVYKDGKMVGQVGRLAGLPGTIISVENLFHNVPSRLASFRQSGEEATRIADLIVRYAIHYPKVAFAFRRTDGSNHAFRSPGNGDQHSAIRTLLHEKASKELVNLEFRDPALHFSASICLCTPAAVFTSRAVQSRHDKLKVFHLFINGRSVDCPRLQRAFDAVFCANDALCPFASLSLQIAPERVDVNVHPTKAIVFFMDEDRIIQRIEQEMQKFLTDYRTRETIPLEDALGNGTRRSESSDQSLAVMHYKKEPICQRSPLLLTASSRPITSSQSSASLLVGGSSSRLASQSSKVAPKDKIRVDFTNRSLDEFVLNKDDQDSPLRPTTRVQLVALTGVEEEEEEQRMLNGDGDAANPITVDEGEGGIGGSASSDSSHSRQVNGQLQLKCIPRMFDFESLVELRKEICREADQQLMSLFGRHLLIGFYDTRHALLQSGAKVFLVRNDFVLHDFFYQLIIFSFGNIGVFDLLLDPTKSHYQSFPPVHDLLRIYLEGEGEADSDGQIEKLSQELSRHRTMLWDFFSIKVLTSPEKDGSPMLAAIPCLIDGYLPDLAGLPRLLFALAGVDYSDEKNCFASIASALAEFHVPFMDSEAAVEKEEPEAAEQIRIQQKQAQRVLRATIYPQLKNQFLPGKKLQQHVQMLTSTSQAFKHFGRC